jgi:CubicO group peptidase (beta-lactamase class C family)
MSSGLNDLVPDNACTLKSCLLYLAAPGTRWAYHNAPYTLLDSVVEKATSQSFNSFIATNIRNPIGMNGAFFRIDYNNVYISNARSMARFGLMILAGGTWNGTAILNDPAYFNQMVNTSQTINQSYGYLWWLNGKSSYRLPSLQLQFPGSFAPNAPADLYAAIGKDGQICAVVPSQKLVVVRMGGNPGDGSLAPVGYIDSMWVRINYASIVTADDQPQTDGTERYKLYPNPATGTATLVAAEGVVTTKFTEARLLSAGGQLARTYYRAGELDLKGLPTGLYTLQVLDSGGGWQGKLVVVE